MSWFITVCLSVDAVGALRNLLPERVHLVDAKACRGVIDGSRFVGNVVLGYSSCELYTSLEDAQDEPTEDERRQALHAKYDTKGWSEAKLERAVTQALASVRRQPAPFVGLREDLRLSLAQFATTVGPLMLTVRFVDGLLGPARFDQAAQTTLSASELQQEEIAITPDIVYEIC